MHHTLQFGSSTFMMDANNLIPQGSHPLFGKRLENCCRRGEQQLIGPPEDAGLWDYISH